VAGPAGQARAAAPTRRSPWRQPAVQRMISAEIISRLGTQLTALAIPWFVLVSTGSISRMGLVFAVELIPVAVLGIPSGHLVARIGVRKTMYAGEGLSAVLIALVPVLHWAGLLSYGALLVIVAAMGLVTAPFLAAQRLMLPEVLGDDEATVVAGNAGLEAVTRTATVAGPAAAGYLIVAVGTLNVLWIDAASYVVSFALLLGLPQAANLAAAAEQGGGRLLDGVRYVLQDHVVGRVVTAAFCYGLVTPFILISLPVMAKIRYGGDPRVAGWLFAAWGIGAVLGTFAVMRLARRLPPIRMGAIGALCLAIPLWFLPLHQPAVTVGIILAVSGIFTSLLNSPLIALLTTRPPPAVRPHVVTLTVTSNFLAAPVAYALAGTLIAHAGLGTVQLAVAAALTACALLVFSLLGYEPTAQAAPALGGDNEAG